MFRTDGRYHALARGHDDMTLMPRSLSFPVLTWPVPVPMPYGKPHRTPQARTDRRWHPPPVAVRDSKAEDTLGVVLADRQWPVGNARNLTSG